MTHVKTDTYRTGPCNIQGEGSVFLNFSMIDAAVRWHEDGLPTRRTTAGHS
jgi:hypothetical protein